MIYSFRPGRVRLRAQALREQNLVQSIQEMLGGYPGIVDFRANCRTGSLLVRYDPEQISQDQLRTALAFIEQRFPGAASGAKSIGIRTPLVSRSTERRMLLGVFALCLAGTMGGKVVHMVAGGAFTLLAARHIYIRRRLLWRAPTPGSGALPAPCAAKSGNRAPVA